MALHPQVQLDVTLSDRFVDLVEEGFDVAVRIGRLGDSSLVSRRLGSTRLLLCAAPSYLKAHGTPIHPNDLVHHHTIGYNLLSDGDQWRFEGPDGPVGVKVRPRLWSNSGDTCCAFARGGGGILLKPCFLVADDLASGALVELLPGWRAPELGIHAVYPSRRHLAPKVRLLVDFLAQALAENAG
jgi:DNA-binding transcriptional LysR family regulator